jgi:hypothetical protein
MNKKGLEVKILMTWLFIIIVFIAVLILIGIFTGQGNKLLEGIMGAW